MPVSDDVYARLERCLGPGELVLDRAERVACSAGVYSAGATCAAVLRPSERAASNQIGRTYRYRENLEPGTARLLDALKGALDPNGRLDPGALGLHADRNGS
jgi:hypothetical protein